MKNKGLEVVNIAMQIHHKRGVMNCTVHTVDKAIEELNKLRVGEIVELVEVDGVWIKEEK